jgi:hypothetical protein
VPEVLANQLAPGALGASLTDVATSITLATGDGATFPAAGPYRVLIHDITTGANAEIITVASRSGDVLTVAARGQETTTGVAHASGDPVHLVLTAGALRAAFGVTAVNVAFTDGDTARRVTIADANVAATTAIVCSVVRPTTALADDKGFTYTASVVSRGAGTFDAWIVCTDVDDTDPVLDPPNETVQLVYMLGA